MAEYSKFRSISDATKYELKQRDWSQKYLAQLMGVNEGQVSKIVNPKKTYYKPEIDTLDKLAKAFGMSVIELLSKIDDSEGSNFEDADFIPPPLSIKQIFGRNNEFSNLTKFLVLNKLILIVGMSGIGKSSLAKAIYESHLLSYDRKIFCACNDNFSVSDIDECMGVQIEAQKLNNVNTRILSRLQQKRCLLILDDLNLEHLEYEESYTDLLKQIVETPHQSCVIVTSRSLPQGYRGWEPRPKVVELQGLTEPEAIELLKNEGLPSEAKSKQVQDLIQKYGGNPWGLKLAVQDILELHNGDLESYLRHSTVFVKELREEIQGILKRLTDLELKILYWLVLHKKSFDINEIREAFSDRNKYAIDGNTIRDAVNELRRRSLLKNHDGQLALLTEVQNCVELDFLKEICREINAINSGKWENLVWLPQLKLDQEKIKLRGRLARSLSEQVLSQSLDQLILFSKESSLDIVGYSVENLRYLTSKAHKL